MARTLGELTPNGVECIDCPGFGNYYAGEEECPHDATHTVNDVCILATPLGRPDDQDYYVARLNKWVYDVIN